MRIKRWNVADLDKNIAAELAEACELHPFLSLLLTAQGVSSPEEAMAFLAGQDESADPFSLADMDAAVDRIERALEAHEKILVFGDYDVDGITATILVYTYLRDRGADVSYRIPWRKDGYGMHEQDIRLAAEMGVNLIVTVDTGVALTAEEMAVATEAGMDIVVTDHHQPPDELPPAVAVVDPHRDDCESGCVDFAGVGVAFMLICALSGDGDAMLTQYGDLLTLGTLADSMPLRGFTRDLMRSGLALLNASTRPGIVALRRVAGCDKSDISATTVNFTLVPRLNAAGRMGDPELAMRLLLARDEAEATALAEELQDANVQRQRVGADILKQMLDQLTEQPSLLNDRVLVIAGDGWHHGVLGIAAARLVEMYGKPVVALSVGEDGVAHGSCRGPAGFSLYEALNACSNILLSFGGHEQAAGVSLAASDIPQLRADINRFAAETYLQMPTAELPVLVRLRPDQIDVEKLALLDILEPFGNGNPVPYFGLFNMRLDNISAIGNGSHTRLSLSRDNVRLNAVRFQMAPEEFPVPCGSIVNCIVTLDKNEYRGSLNVSIRIKDISYADADRDRLLQNMIDFDAVCRRELCPTDALPTRDQLTRIYSLLHRCGSWTGTLEQFQYAVARTGGESEPIDGLRLLVAIELWREAGILTYRDRGELFTVELQPTDGKVDLTATPLWQYLERGM